MSSSGRADQLPLWEAERPARRRRRTGASRPAGPEWLTVTGNDFLSRGWPTGTVLHHEPATRADRGDLAVVRQGESVLVGFFGLDRGRPALFTDRGATWLAEGARVVGRVTAVEAPLIDPV